MAQYGPPVRCGSRIRCSAARAVGRVEHLVAERAQVRDELRRGEAAFSRGAVVDLDIERRM
jgi:hypothetical protein